MKKIAIIGAGGINSFVAQHLRDVCKLFEKEELIYVKIFDEDTVEEKNILRQNQNFTADDLMEDKAETLAKRYKFDFDKCFITEENIKKLEPFDDIILGVDNHKARKLIYKYCWDNNKWLLDLRANGSRTSYFMLDRERKWEDYEKEHFSNVDVMERKGGCQRKQDIETDNIQCGNKIIAYMGMWGIFLKHLRKEEIEKYEYRDVY